MLTKWIRVRIILVACGLGIFFLAIVVRLIDLKFIQGPTLREKAQREYQKDFPVLPVRGSIFDRNHTELAISTFVKSLAAHPRRLTDKKELSRQLAPRLGMTPAAVLEILDQDRPFVWVKRHLTPQQAAAVEQFKADYDKQLQAQRKKAKDAEGPPLPRADAIYLLPEPKRYYPHRTLAGPLLGFCNADGHGAEGLERYFDEYIFGKPQRSLNIIDARGQVVLSGEKELMDETMGDNLVLSIDRTIQYIAEKELQQGVQKWNAAGGFAVVMVPQTGEILAMAQVPGFDPNHYNKYTKEFYQNRNVTVAVEPGSTFKIFTVAAALDAKVVRPTDRYHCENGKFAIGNAGVIHDVHPYGSLTVAEVIKKSSNIGAAKIGMKLGPQKMDHYLKGFGFGQRTGITYAGENFGLVRNIMSNRSLIDRVTVAFGQGITITPIQMAMALGAMANNGILMRPLLVKEIVDHQGRVVKQFQPTPVRQVISAETAQTMMAMMKTVTEPGGTGTEAVPKGYTVAGKTGTAQKVVGRSFSKSKYYALFIGAVPAERPVLAIVVIVDEPKGAIYGGTVAAPIFREIAGQAMRFLGYFPSPQPPSPTETIQVKHPAPAPAKVTPLPPLPAAVVPIDNKNRPLHAMPNLKGKTIREVIAILSNAGIRCQVEGQGLAFDQKPEPGAPLPANNQCLVRFKSR
jgi:cell division protein FtsI (penicillin-binding protein 3)